MPVVGRSASLSSLAAHQCALHRRRRRAGVRCHGGRSWPGLTWPFGPAAVPGMFRNRAHGPHLAASGCTQPMGPRERIGRSAAKQPDRESAPSRIRTCAHGSGGRSFQPLTKPMTGAYAVNRHGVSQLVRARSGSLLGPGVEDRGCAVCRFLGRLWSSPPDAPIPAFSFSTRMTGCFVARPSVIAGSQ